MVRRLVLLVLAITALAAPIESRAGFVPVEPRFAFVVSNQNHARELIPLQFSHADGEIVAAALNETGFNVLRLKDATRAEFQHGLFQFVERVKAAGPNAVALFYFSGHVWAEAETGRNFVVLNERLPEAAAAIARQDDDGFKRALMSNLPRIGVPLVEVTKALRALELKAAFAVIDSHMDVAEPNLVAPVAGKVRDNGLMLVAQGRPGKPAADSNDFSKAFAGAILTPGLNALATFKQVQVKVMEVTNGKHEPWIENRLTGDFFFTPRRDVPQGAIRISAADPQHAQIENALWDAVKDTDDPRVIEHFAKKFPNGRHSAAAKELAERLARKELINVALDKQLKRDAGLSGIGSMPAAEDVRSILPGLAERRVALVIGNASYKHSTKLPNPANDAKAMAQVLRDLRFAGVQEHYDLDRAGFVAALKSFGEVASGADWAVVYYAGHGMEVSGTNVLLPVDAKLERIEDVEDEAVPVKRLFDRLADVKGIKIVILDACRDNPIAARALKKRGAVSFGLAQAANVDSGTLIALAADPGKPAYDGQGPHSPYAEALLKHIKEPRLDVRIMFGRVNDTLLETMPGKQESWIQVKLSGQRQYYFQPE